jgi:ferredoxin
VEAFQIDIDRERCIGSGNCVFWAPGTFDLDDEGKSIVIDPRGDADEAIANAADGCPTAAIRLTSKTDQPDGRR